MCFVPDVSLCASLRSRNAHEHVKRVCTRKLTKKMPDANPAATVLCKLAQQPFFVKIYRGNVKPGGYHLDWTPGFRVVSKWFRMVSDWFLTGFPFAPPPFSLARCKLACCMPTVLTLTSPMMIMRSRVRKCYLELYFETCEMFALWNDVWDETLKWFCYHLFVTRWDADYSEPIAWSVTNKMRIIFDNSGLYAWSRQKLTKPVKTQHHTRIKKKTRNKTIDLNVAGQKRQVVETPSPAARSHQFYFFFTVVSNRKRNPCGWAFMVS